MVAVAYVPSSVGGGVGHAVGEVLVLGQAEIVEGKHGEPLHAAGVVRPAAVAAEPAEEEPEPDHDAEYENGGGTAERRNGGT